MSRRLTAFTLSRAGWGNSHSLDPNVRQIETACDPETLPNLLRVKADAPLAAMLSWPGLSGCALQCQYEIGPVDRGGSVTLMSAEAVQRGRSGKTFEIELVNGWRGEPYYWGSRPVHEEEVEAAIHGLAPNDDLQLRRLPAGRDTHDAPRARILESRTDTAVLFVAVSLEEAGILSGVVERLCDTGALVQCTDEVYPLEGSSLTGTEYQRTDKPAPLVTRWLGGHGTRSQQAQEQRSGAPCPLPIRWSGVSP